MAQETSPTTNPEPAGPPRTSGIGGSRFEQNVSDIYEELRQFGANLRRREHDVTLTTAQVLNDLCVRPEGAPGLTEPESRSYRRAAARAMRMLLVKAARNQVQRPGTTKQIVYLTLGTEAAPNSSSSPPDSTPGHVLSLDRALNELHLLDSYQADLLEMKYFGGFSLPDTAEHLQLPEAKVARDLRAAEAWLKVRLRDLS